MSDNTNFTKLPEVCFRDIFDQISLHELLFGTKNVCHAWNQQVRIQLRSRRSLTLVGRGVDATTLLNSSKFGQAEYRHQVAADNGLKHQIEKRNNFNQLKIGFLCEQFVDFLTDAMPNVTELVVVQKNVPSSEARLVAKLISRYVLISNHF